MFIVLVILLAGSCIIGYMYFLAHHDHMRHEDIIHPNIPELDGGYKIFFIADIHRRIISQTTIDKVKEEIDIVCIGGDLLERGVPLRKVKKNIIRLKKWKVPLYFVWGNNDLETDVSSLKKLLMDEEVIILEDELVPLFKNNKRIWLAGFKYEIYPEHDKAMISWNETEDEMTLLLTHKPSSFHLLHDHVKRHIDVVLAGHTHGGQIRLLGHGPYKNGGLEKFNNTNMFITEGYGCSLLPLRLGTRAECHVINLKHVNS